MRIRQSSGIHRSEKPSGGHGCRFQNQERRRRSARKSSLLCPDRRDLESQALRTHARRLCLPLRVRERRSAEGGQGRMVDGKGAIRQTRQFRQCLVDHRRHGNADAVPRSPRVERCDTARSREGQRSAPGMAGPRERSRDSGLGQRPIGQDAELKTKSAPVASISSTFPASPISGPRPREFGSNRNIRWTRAKA